MSFPTSIVATFAAFANIAEVVDLTNIGTLFAFVLVSVGVIFLLAVGLVFYFVYGFRHSALRTGKGPHIEPVKRGGH